jgi:hypothetical protein
MSNTLSMVKHPFYGQTPFLWSNTLSMVKHPFYGQTDMPFSVVKDALTTTEQNTNFIRQAAIAISAMDFNNAPKEKFRAFFQDVANELIKAV